MAVIGFHYNKMLVEKKKPINGKVDVKSNLSFTSLKTASVNMGKEKQKGVEFSFLFKSMYEPDTAVVELHGALVYLGDESTIDTMVKNWEAKKDIPIEVMEEVYNYLLAKCNIQALVLGRDMGLPPHLKLPRLDAKKQ